MKKKNNIKNDIKVLHLGFSDSPKSGSSMAMLNIHKDLIKNKINSSLLVVQKYSFNKRVVQFDYIQRKINFLKRLITFSLKKIQNFGNIDIHRSYNYFNSNYVVNKINNSSKKIIHLHWVHGEMLSTEDIIKIKKPIIWTLHDAWITNPTIHVDIKNQKKFVVRKGFENFFLKRKKKLLINKKIYFIAPSKALFALCSKKLKLKNLYYIPHKVSKKFNKISNFKNPNFISKKEKNLLFFSYTHRDGFVKGNDLFLKILLQLSQDGSKYHVYICGFKNEKLLKEIKNIRLTFLGYLNDEKLNKLYNSVDLLVSCSRFESFGQTIFEARKAGLPIISFKVGGVLDVINNKGVKLIDCYDYKKMSKEISTFFKSHKKFSKDKKKNSNEKIKKMNYEKIYLKALRDEK